MVMNIPCIPKFPKLCLHCQLSNQAGSLNIWLGAWGATSYSNFIFSFTVLYLSGHYNIFALLWLSKFGIPMTDVWPNDFTVQAKQLVDGEFQCLIASQVFAITFCHLVVAMLPQKTYLGKSKYVQLHRLVVFDSQIKCWKLIKDNGCGCTKCI